MSFKFIPLILIILVLVCVGIFAYYHRANVENKVVISSYEECVAAGNPAQESYPPRCTSKDGQSFTQEIGNELELTNEIQITNPRPNQIIEKDLEVLGQATGAWLFEGQTSMNLYDADDNVITSGIIVAQSEWTTPDLVPFKGTLNFTQPNSQKGKLVIEKSNPSGLGENEKALVVPIYFK